MIPIVFGIDKSYILQVFTVMHSILKNSKAEIHFIVFSKVNIEPYNKEFVAVLSKTYRNFMFEIRMVDESAFDDAKLYHKHLSHSSYFRLLIPELVKDYEKCVYLDSDILVNGDIQELFSADIEDYYVAGVQDCHRLFGRDYFIFFNEHLKKNMPSAETYVNAGVLVMNLTKLRNDNMTEKFLLQAKQKNPYEDQDVINLCCYEAIKILPVRYNRYQHYTGNTAKLRFERRSAGEQGGADWNQPFILHLISRYKPWLNKKYKSSDLWWETAELFKDSYAYQSLFQKCREPGEDLRELKHLFEVCSKEKKVILWGFTDQGRDVCDIFLNRGILPYAFCDNDQKKQGESYRGVSVWNPDSVTEKAEGIIWVITCKNAFEEVQRQLMDAGAEETDIFHFIYNNRDKEEYFVIDPRYYEEELQIIALCENDKAKMEDSAFLSYIQGQMKKENMEDETYLYLYSKYRFDLWLKA